MQLSNDYCPIVLSTMARTDQRVETDQQRVQPPAVDQSCSARQLLAAAAAVAVLTLCCARSCASVSLITAQCWLT